MSFPADRLRRGATVLVALPALALLAGVDAQHVGTRGPVSRVLRVCADPNNLPFSNRQGQGFENRIADLIAGDLHATLQYTWWPQQRGFLRRTLSAGRCDVVLGTVAGTDRMLTTAPYYSSDYAFVTRRDRGPAIRSFDDPRLRALTIGVPVIGQDYNSLPPAVALAQRHLVRHVVGYMLYGSDSSASPWAKLIDAVAQGRVDVAIAWGPPAGYFARRAAVPLDVVPVSAADARGSRIPFVYAIAAGVRQRDTALRAQLDQALAHQRDSIQRVLHSYAVPTVQSGGAGVIPGISPAVVYGNLVNPFAGKAPAIAEGRQLFVWYNCSGCHGGRAGGGMGPSLRDSTQRRYGNSDTQLFATISEGRPLGMPAWGRKLPADQIWKLIAYIRTLGTPQEPDRVVVPRPRT